MSGAPPSPTGSAQAPGPHIRARALGLLLVMALSSAAVMVAQLAGPRLVARYLGTSLFTWASTIATFLGGLALGNAWGGRIADARGVRWLPALLLASGMAVAATLPLDAWLAHVLPHVNLTPRARALLGIPLLFLPCSLLLGTLGPLLARALVLGAGAPGRSLGALSAAGSLGAVAGVLLAGYGLIPHVGTRSILLGTAGALSLLGLLVWALSRGQSDAPNARSTGSPAPSPPPAENPTASPPPARVRQLPVLAFLAGAAFLALEIVAARHAVLGLGSSIYTWTAVLAVILSGGALGAWLGGLHADRVLPRRAVADVLAWSVLGMGICLWTPLLMGRALPAGAPWPLATLLAVAAGFLLPAVSLGALSPALARAALASRQDVDGGVGRTLGRMQALGTLGAVVGALATAYLLIPLGNVHVVVLITCLLLALAADHVMGARALLPVRGVLTLLVVFALAPAGAWNGLGDTLAGLGRRLGLREDGPGVWVRESGYYRIRIDDDEQRWCTLSEAPDLRGLAPALGRQASYEPARRRLYWSGPPMESGALEELLARVSGHGDGEALQALAARTRHTVRQMALDKLTHGFVDLEDPTWVGYDYEVVAAAVWRHAPRAGRGQRAFFVGGGPYTFQRRLLALDPQAELVTAEIDPAVTRAARDELALPASERHVIQHEDARLVLPRLPAEQRFDVVFGDAFNDFSVPFHLTTREFAVQVQERLAPGGLYLVNVVDVWDSGLFLGAFRRTLAAVFAHTAVFTLAPRSDGTRETFLLVASDAPLALDPLLDDFRRPLPVVRYTAEDLDGLRARAGPELLTDDFAPVEALLAPVARRAAENP